MDIVSFESGGEPVQLLAIIPICINSTDETRSLS